MSAWNRGRVLCFCCFCLTALPLRAFGQTEPQVVARIDCRTDGRTSRAAILAFTGLREGQVFPSASALQARLDEARRALEAEDVFKATEILDVPSGPSGGMVEHDLTIVLEGGPIAVPLADLSFDSNYGYTLGAQAFFYDALGTMSTGYLDGNFVLSVDDPGEVVGWDFHGCVTDIMLWGASWAANLEIKRSDADLVYRGTQVADWRYCLGTATLAAHLRLGHSWYCEIEPGYSAQFGTIDLLGNGACPGDYTGPDFREALGLDRVAWTGDFRSGYALRLEHFLQAELEPGGPELSNEVSATALYYRPWSIFDYYVRLRAQADFGRCPTDLGKYLRGIPDDSMPGRAGVFLDQTLGIDLGLPRRICDLQLHPFLDLGGVLPPSGPWDSRSDFRAGAGLEVIGFTDLVPGLVVRFTLGFDLGSPDPLVKPEIHLSSDLSY